MNKRCVIAIVVGAVLHLCLALSVGHAAIAVTVQDQGTNPFGNLAWTFGYVFQPNVDIDVTALGFLDVDADGLAASHDVAVWDRLGNLLASTTVSNSDPLNGFYRFNSITPLRLTAGTDYVIASHDFRADDAIRDDLGVVSTVHPDITIVDGGYAFPSGSINFLTNYYGDPSLFFNTASFEFTAVPEPPSCSRWCLLAAMGVCLRRRRS